MIAGVCGELEPKEVAALKYVKSKEWKGGAALVNIRNAFRRDGFKLTDTEVQWIMTTLRNAGCVERYKDGWSRVCYRLTDKGEVALKNLP